MEFMDSQHQKKRDKDEEKQYHEGKFNFNQGSKESQHRKQQVQPSSTSTTTTATASTPSPSSSPSHEFSFTISLQPSSSSATSTTSTTSTARSTTNNIPSDKSKSSPASFALDLSPADEIFFHGHLLPLHLLSHLPVSPRSSTNSLDSFTLPIKELYQDGQNLNNHHRTNTNSKSEKNSITEDRMYNGNKNHIDYETRGRTNKSKSFSLFGISSKWRKENINTNIDAREKKEDKADRQKRKLKLVDVSHVLKRYMRMVRPLLSFGSSRRGNMQFHRQSCSYSGNLSLRRKPDFRGRRGEFSAPASMRTSPTNSGLLVATATLSTSSSSDSTMEELQAAIQAAIAHCKNSIAMEEKIKCRD